MERPHRCAWAESDPLRDLGQTGGEGANLFLLFGDGLRLYRNRRRLFGVRLYLGIHAAVFLEEFIEQHRVYRLVANGVRLPLFIACDQVGIDFFDFLGDEAELRNAFRVQLLFVTKRDRL